MIFQFNNFIFLKKVSFCCILCSSFCARVLKGSNSATDQGLTNGSNSAPDQVLTNGSNSATDQVLRKFNPTMKKFLGGIKGSPIPIECDTLSADVQVLPDKIDKNQFYTTYLEPFFSKNIKSAIENGLDPTDRTDANLYSYVEVQNSNYLVHPQAVTFTERTTAQAIAIAYSNIPPCESMDIFALNFANEFRCGGGPGFTKELLFNSARAKAQEENLVAEKIDGFFQSMHTYTHKDLRYKEEYKGFSNKGNTFISQNLKLRAIDNVGTDRDKPDYNLSTHSSCLLSEEGIRFTLFTSAAPNLRPRNHSIQGKPPRPLKDRIQDHLNAMNFQLSQTKSDSAHIILGAFGCGAFGNDPSEVARDYFDTLREFNWCKPVTIEFAVPNIIKKPPSSDDRNVVAFRTMVQKFNALN